jgi:uncharacterized protein (TIGR02444 family)
MWQKNRRSQAGEALWRFSLALYVRPGVAAALLALQDRAGRNVNLLLFALWLGAACGIRLDASNLAVAQAAIAEIDAGVVQTLRRLRREQKEAADPAVQVLRRRVQTLEIVSEREVQYRLAETAETFVNEAHGDALAAADANLVLCLGPEANSLEAAVLRGSLADLMRHAPAEAR